MDRVSKVVLVLTTILVVAAWDVEAARRIKNIDGEEVVDHPQNFFGGAAGGIFPGPPGYATGFGFGPSSFCSLPGGCVPLPGFPIFPGVPVSGGSPPIAP